MRVRMSSFTCTLTGGSQFAICNLRNLREHFLSKFRVKKVSGKTALTYTESVDTNGNVVRNWLTVLLVSNSSVNCQLFWKRHGSPHIFAFSIFEKMEWKSRKSAPIVCCFKEKVYFCSQVRPKCRKRHRLFRPNP